MVVIPAERITPKRCQHDDNSQVAAQAPPFNIEGGLENQRRQQDSEQEILGERHSRRESRERQGDSGRHQPGAVGQVELLRQHRDHNCDQEQEGAALDGQCHGQS